MSDSRKVPGGRLERIVKLGFGGAKAGAKLLVSGHAGAAEQATQLLGNLRGLAAKAGQIASYVDGVIPEEHRETFERTLGTLRAAAPSSPPEAVRKVLEEELGAPPEALFASFEDRPFASASIGQVHRARLADGREVAVKIQHPGIDRAVLADLDNARLMESMVGGLGARKVGSREVIEEVRTRFLEELDYRLEAERQTRFAALFADDPLVSIPEVVAERSSKRVLTSSFVTGLTLDEASRAPEAERHAWAVTLWRFVFSGNLLAGMFNADPHPGNYLFNEGGRVTFLDFGCVQPLTPEHLGHARRLHRAAVARDEAAFREGARALLGTRPGSYEDWALAYSRRCFEPIFGSPFRMDRAYTTSLVRAMGDMKRDVMFAKGSGFVPLPPGMLFMNRLQFGFYSVLARLDASVDYAGIEAEILARLPGP